MSALARYFKLRGLVVGGYDRSSTALTDELSREGISVHFNDDVSLIGQEFLDRTSCMVIYTPAVPPSHSELSYFRKEGFKLLKRSAVLGGIIWNERGIAISGTHGKTTVSSMLAEILNLSSLGCNAFLGGISKNLNSNLVVNPGSGFYVVEADEYDRSFLQLFPELAVVTSMDPDHLDIYGDFQGLRNGFEAFLSQVDRNGTILVKKGIDIRIPDGVTSLCYHLDDPGADFYAMDIVRSGFRYTFTFVANGKNYPGMELGVYGRLNLENAIAALAVSEILGVDEVSMKKGIGEFRGVKRRFDVQLETDDHIYIDDYAHHPQEIRSFLTSVKEALPGKEITGIFQPHLYSRTRDHAREFSESLSMLDHVILLDIYPAREEPVRGVDSNLILKELNNRGERILADKKQLLKIIAERKPPVLLTMGAGDIDQLVEGIKMELMK